MEDKSKKIALVALVFGLLAIGSVTGTIQNLIGLTCTNCTLDNPTFVNYTFPSGNGSDYTKVNKSGEIGLSGLFKSVVSSGTPFWGFSTNGYGVFGGSTNSYGVHGNSINSYGVRGASGTSTGVYGYSSNGYGGDFVSAYNEIALNVRGNINLNGHNITNCGNCGSSGTNNHSELNQLNWSEAGHIIDGPFIAPYQGEISSVDSSVAVSDGGIIISSPIVSVSSIVGDLMSELQFSADQLLFQHTNSSSGQNNQIVINGGIQLNTDTLITNGNTGQTVDVPYLEDVVTPKTMHFTNGILTSIT